MPTLPRIPGMLLAQLRSVCSGTDWSQAWHPLVVPCLKMHWHSENQGHLGCSEVLAVERLLLSPFAPSDALCLVCLALTKVGGTSLIGAPGRNNFFSLVLPHEPLVGAKISSSAAQP